MACRLGWTRGRLAALCLWAALPGSLLVGCLGSGDDASSAALASDAGDAHAGDGAGADGHAEGAAADAASEVADGAHEADAGEATLLDAADARTGNPPLALLSATGIDFGQVGCGSMPATKTLTITNGGGSSLAVSASKVGSAFTVNPTALMLPHGMSGTFTLTATVPASATAGTPLIGSLVLFMNDPASTSVVLRLSATPSGATLTGTSVYSFPSPEIGFASAPVALQLRNTGNAPATFMLAPPSDPSVTLTGLPDGGAITLNAGDALSASATFKPTNTNPVSAPSAITATGVMCGSSVSMLTFNGQAAIGAIQGWPGNNTLDFGPANCGGAAPPPQTIMLTNSGATDARIIRVDNANIGGFATDANTKVGFTIPANRAGALTLNFTAPPVAAPSAGSAVALTPMSRSVVIHTDADPSAQGTTITLTEEPQGAVLSFGDPTTPGCTTSPNLGTFTSPGILLQPVPPQNFCVVNTGNAKANVILVAAENGDGGAPADGGGDATVDATVASSIPSPFSTLPSTFAIPMATNATTPKVQQESLTFQPVHANATVGSLVMTVDSTTVLCAVLPQPLPLSGSAIGGGPVVTPTGLTFEATCGGSAPGAQTFVVSNAGTVDMNWTISAIAGPGAAQYSVSASPPAGLLHPGASSTVTVNAVKVPSPAPNPNPAALAAQVTITTDVPFDPPHIVTLNEVPLGDQLSVALGDPLSGSLRFGQVPVGTGVTRSFTITNSANIGSQLQSASLSLAIGGPGAAAYSLASQMAAPAAGGSSVTISLTFNAATAIPYPGALTFTTTDALCTALPAPIVLSGTGTSGSVSLSATTLAFGAPGDASGLVNCGSTGQPQKLTISNIGNQTFNVTAIALGKGANSPFTLSATTLPLQLPIAASTVLTITPSIIPSISVDPNDTARFSDALTITTDAAGDAPHNVPLAMQARGAVIVPGVPLPTTWNFGTVGAGSIGTFSPPITNNGNLAAMVSLKGLSQPMIFCLHNNPTTAAPNGATALVGQFTPPSPNGTWNDQGTLVVSADAFCDSLPSQWISPVISLLGSSGSNPIVTRSTNQLTFPTTNCGDGFPGPQPVTLTNATNQAYAYVVSFASGTAYTFTDPAGGVLGAHGTATIAVTPKALTIPGPGVLPGSAPYLGQLLIDIATMPTHTIYQVAISWMLNGAVLSLPQGAGPNSDAANSFYYLADSNGIPLPMVNTGTATATVDGAIQPSGAFAFQPAPPISVLASGSPTAPQLVSGTSSASCPTTTNGTLSFHSSGPVCQDFAQKTVNVRSCVGTHP
jgi:hypothetical protein